VGLSNQRQVNTIRGNWTKSGSIGC